MIEAIEKADWERVQNLRYILGTDNGKVAELISHSQLVDHLEATANEENKTNDDLYNLRALIGRQGTPRHQTPIGRSASIVSLMNGRLGRRPMNLSQL